MSGISGQEPHPFDQPHGWTTDGIAWRWMDRPIRASRLLLMGEVAPSGDQDDWRVDHSQRVLELFCALQLPGVGVEWLRARDLPTSQWETSVDCLPIWDLGGERHAFLYGITEKLWSSLNFYPHPPNALVKEWVEWHVDCDLEI
jgi:hypothetical protein